MTPSPHTASQNPDDGKGYKDSRNKDFKIHLSVFEGPFDLLLHLIDEKQIDLYDVKLSDITDAYLGYILAAEREQVELGSEFLMMAATLIELKSRMLLPTSEPLAESLLEELAQERMAILNRLFDYKIFKQLSGLLEDRRDWAARFFTPDRVDRRLPDTGPVPVIFRNADLQKLFGAFNQVWLEAQKRQTPIREEDIFDDVYTVSECMDHVLVKLASSGVPTRFRDLFSLSSSLGEVIVTFLAILELVRLQRASLQQDERDELLIACLSVAPLQG